MMNRTKKMFGLLLAITVLFGCAVQTVLAAVHSDVITSIEALLANGSGPVGDINQWQIFRLRAKFALPNNTVRNGDTTVITLPPKLRFAQTASFELKDDDGNVVANAIINGPAKTITLTYTDYAETHSDVTGNFYFYVKIDRNQVDGEEWIPLEIDVSGTPVSGDPLYFTGIPIPTGRPLSKSGWYSSTQTDKRTLEYQLAINTVGQAMQDVTITDKIISPGVNVKRDSLRIYKGNWVAVHGDWDMQNEVNVTLAYPPTWNADGSFTIHLGNIAATDGFLINYQAVAEYDLVDGEQIKNKAVLTGDNINPYTANFTTTYFEAGGSAEGYVYTIKIHKQSEDDLVLAGAVFDVIRLSNNVTVGTIQTDATGSAEITGLLKDNYQLVERTAPTGYTLLSAPINISPEDFGPDKVAEVTITNHPSKTSVPVTKVWDDVNDQDGKRPDSVTVRLLADGADTGETKELNADNGWTATFTDLDEYKDGELIVYTLEEVQVAGYTVAITGDASGYTVTNSHTPGKTSVPVTKVWDDANDQDGKRPDSVTVRLLADGADTGETKELSADNGWTATFTSTSRGAVGEVDFVEIVENCNPVNSPLDRCFLLDRRAFLRLQGAGQVFDEGFAADLPAAGAQLIQVGLAGPFLFFKGFQLHEEGDRGLGSGGRDEVGDAGESGVDLFDGLGELGDEGLLLILAVIHQGVGHVGGPL